MTLLWIALAIAAGLAAGIWLGITLFENAARDAIEGLMGRKTNEPRFTR